MNSPSRAPAWLTPVTDYAPLALFLAAYYARGLMVATAVFMAATFVALLTSWLVARRLPVVGLVTAAIVGVLGGLTLWLNDDNFIKMKPTIVYGLFATIIAVGLATGRPLIKPIFGAAIPPMDDAGWRTLSLRFLVFFLIMAAANEVARRILTTDMWVMWKVPGALVTTFAFSLAQAPLVKRHMIAEENP